MAKAAKIVKARPAKGGKARQGPALWVLGLAVLAVLPFAMPTILLLVFGLVPTIVAGFVDRSPARNAWICVGGLNFAGLSYFLLELWDGRHTVAGAIDILTDVTALLSILGASAIGWIFFTALPPVFGTALTMLNERKAAALRSEQQKLIEMWGEKVAEED